jgi:hypothetical protein
MDNPSLNINDLQLIKNIIDLASSRGSFRASEMQIVGEVYNRLSAFLDTTNGTDNDNVSQATNQGE